MLIPQHTCTQIHSHIYNFIFFTYRHKKSNPTSLQYDKYTLHRYTKHTQKPVSLSITVNFTLPSPAERHKHTQAPPVSMSSTDLWLGLRAWQSVEVCEINRLPALVCACVFAWHTERKDREIVKNLSQWSRTHQYLFTAQHHSAKIHGCGHV